MMSSTVPEEVILEGQHAPLHAPVPARYMCCSAVHLTVTAENFVKIKTTVHDAKTLVCNDRVYSYIQGLHNANTTIADTTRKLRNRGGISIQKTNTTITTQTIGYASPDRSASELTAHPYPAMAHTSPPPYSSSTRPNYHRPSPWQRQRSLGAGTPPSPSRSPKLPRRDQGD